MPGNVNAFFAFLYAVGDVFEDLRRLLRPAFGDGMTGIWTLRLP